MAYAGLHAAIRLDIHVDLRCILSSRGIEMRGQHSAVSHVVEAHRRLLLRASVVIVVVAVVVVVVCVVAIVVSRFCGIRICRRACSTTHGSSRCSLSCLTCSAAVCMCMCKSIHQWCFRQCAAKWLVRGCSLFVIPSEGACAIFDTGMQNALAHAWLPVLTVL